MIECWSELVEEFEKEVKVEKMKVESRDCWNIRRQAEGNLGRVQSCILTQAITEPSMSSS